MSSEVIASSAVVEAIQESTNVEMIGLDGQSYFTKRTYLPPQENCAEPLEAHTLKAVESYLRANDSQSEAIAHVLSPTHVQLVSPLQGRHNQRHVYLSTSCAEVNKSQFRFNVFLELEPFIIGLLSQFVDTGDRAKVLQIVGNLRSENVTAASDDGFSQSVSTRKGVASVQNTDVPSIVHLAPFRTFRAIDQPISSFLLRFQQSSSGMPKVGLFEADGGSWRLTAIKRIALHLTQSLGEMNVPIIY